MAISLYRVEGFKKHPLDRVLTVIQAPPRHGNGILVLFDDKTVCFSPGYLPLLRVELSPANSVYLPQIVCNLFKRHLVQGTDVEDEIEFLGGEQLDLVRRKKPDAGSPEFLLHILESLEATELENLFFGKNGAQIFLGKIESRRNVDDGVGG